MFKNIKSLEQYLNESRSNSITSDEFFNILNKNCKQFNPNARGFLYRGIQTTEPILFNDPKNHFRTSKDNNNYYTLLIDNSKNWKDYPKRSKSIIMANNELFPGTYGNIYVVIPFDNAKLAIAPKDDIWNSFETGLEKFGLDQINQLNFILSTLHSLIESTPLEEKDWNTFEKQLKKIDENKDLIFSKFVDLNISEKRKESIRKFLDIYMKHNGSLYDLIMNSLDPKLNDFILVTWNGNDLLSKFKNKAREIWTESPCLLVNANNFMDLFNK